MDSQLFQDNKDYVRRQFVFGLLQVRLSHQKEPYEGNSR